MPGKRIAKRGDYRAFLRAVDAMPLARHGRDTDGTRIERITRPVDATPRKLQDWR